MPPQHSCLKKRRVVGPNPRPAQALNNHNFAALPKRHFIRSAIGGRLRPRGTRQRGGARARPARAPTSARQRARQRAQATRAAPDTTGRRLHRVHRAARRAKVVRQEERRRRWRDRQIEQRAGTDRAPDGKGERRQDGRARGPAADADGGGERADDGRRQLGRSYRRANALTPPSAMRSGCWLGPCRRPAPRPGPWPRRHGRRPRSARALRQRRRRPNGRRAGRSALPRPAGRSRRPADKPTAIQPRFLTQWSMLHAVGGASKLPAKVNDRSGASGGA